MFDQALVPLVEAVVRKALLLSAFKGVCSRVTAEALVKEELISVTWCPTGEKAEVTVELITNELKPRVIFAALIVVHDDEEMPIYFVTRAWKLAYIHELERQHRSEVRNKRKNT